MSINRLFWGNTEYLSWTTFSLFQKATPLSAHLDPPLLFNIYVNLTGFRYIWLVFQFFLLCQNLESVGLSKIVLQWIDHFQIEYKCGHEIHAHNCSKLFLWFQHSSTRESMHNTNWITLIGLKVVVRACHGAYLVAHILIFGAKFGFRETCMILLFRVCTTEFGTFNCPRGLQLPTRLSNCYLITGRIQLDCFDSSVYSQCALYNKTWLKFQKALFALAVVYEQCSNE